MSVFDNHMFRCFRVVENLYGDVATWQPSGGSQLYTEKVLFRNPNDPISTGETDRYQYRPYDYQVEYPINKFNGLKESVDARNDEFISVKGFTLIIREVRAKFDGQTLTAYGELYEALVEEENE